MLQNRPYQHLIRVAFRLVLRQGDDTTKHSMLYLSNAAEACGLGQALSSDFIGIRARMVRACARWTESRFFLGGNSCGISQWLGARSWWSLPLYGNTSRGRLFTSTPRSSGTLMRVFPFMIRPSGLTLSASIFPGCKDWRIAVVGCLRQYSRAMWLVPVSKVWSEWMRRSGGVTAR